MREFPSRKSGPSSKEESQIPNFRSAQATPGIPPGTDLEPRSGFGLQPKRGREHGAACLLERVHGFSLLAQPRARGHLPKRVAFGTRALHGAHPSSPAPYF